MKEKTELVTVDEKKNILLQLVHNMQGSVNDALARAGYASRLGQSYGKDRDLYLSLIHI